MGREAVFNRGVFFFISTLFLIRFTSLFPSRFCFSTLFSSFARGFSFGMDIHSFFFSLHSLGSIASRMDEGGKRRWKMELFVREGVDCDTLEKTLRRLALRITMN